MKNILKRTAAMLLILVMVFTSIPASASAANYTNFNVGDTLIVKVSGGINMRKQPVTTSAVLLCVPYGKYVSVLNIGTGSSAGWIRVSYGSTTGWVYAKNDGWFEALAPTVYKYPSNTYEATVIATTGLLVHSTPYLINNNVIDTLPYKTVVDMIGYTKNGLTQISYKKNSKTYNGYVATKYLSYSKKTVKETFKKIYGYSAKVSDDIAALNVRSAANTTSSILTTLDPEQLALIVSESANFYKVKVTVNGKTKKGYVSKAYTSKVDSLKKNVSLNKTKKTLTVGKKYTLKVKNTANLNLTTTWKTNKKSVATVNSKGRVTAKKAGTATITCTVKTGTRTRKIKCKITVKKAS